MLSPTARLLASAVLLSSWLLLLFLGYTFGGAVYLLFVGSLAVFPWRTLKP